VFREDVLASFLALKVNRPVAWLSTRSEDLVGGMHGRDMVSDVEAAVKNDGTVLGLRLTTVANAGGHAFRHTPVPPQRLLNYPTGCYQIQNLDSEVTAVLTNTAATGPYRGAGRPEAAYVAERVMEAVAAELGLSQPEVRRRNFIPADAFPYPMVGGVIFDSGAYERTMDVALDQVGYEALLAEQAERRARGEIVGVGLATYVEVAGMGWESGRITLEPDGSVTAITGTSPHGQGLKTTFAQIIGDELGVDPDKVRVLSGDTEQIESGTGTFGSRSVMIGGSVLKLASVIVRERALRVASSLLEASPADLELREGRASVIGAPNRSVSVADLIVAAGQGTGLTDDEAHQLSEQTRFESKDGDTFPFGSAVAVVSIDRETAHLKLERLLIVDDCGRAINPLLVEGQLLGGAVQGIGEALLEAVLYDEGGQLITGSLMDYAAPRASDLPMLELRRTETPSPRNPLGAKGVGEAGTVGSPAAIANAVVDALRPLGITSVDLPITTSQLWQLLENAE
jgi:carbon-monoxide dehydrogenase large subunit